MKITSEKRTLESAGLAGEEQAFTIKASAKAFAVLSSNIYSDKITAVIREISANAYDAHVMIGNQATPFEVHLPTSFEPFFYVKDFGPGLSESQVMSLYTQYFNSTKEDDDSQTGCLGIGSKSPFAYIDQFTVESRFGGEKKVYVAFLNEGGMPGIRLISTEPSSEHTGLTVHLAVKSEDFSEFDKKAKRVLSTFQTIPDCLGVKIPATTYHVRTEDWGVRSVEEKYRAHLVPRLIQGNISYPIKLEHLPFYKGMEYTEQSMFREGGIDLFVPLGSANIAASREDLHYDKATIANVEALLRKFRAALIAEVQAKIDAEAKSWWHAMQIIHTGDTNNGQLLSRNVHYYIKNRAATIKFKGTPLTDGHVEVKVPATSSIRRGEKSRLGHFRMADSRLDVEIQASFRNKIFIYDLEKRVSISSIITNFLTVTPDFDYLNIYCFDKSDEQLVLDTMKINKDEIMYASKLPALPKVEKVKSLKKYAPGLEKTDTTITLRQLIIKDRVITPIHETRSSVLLSEVKYYMPVNGSSIVTPPGFPISLNDIVVRIAPTGFLDTFGKIYLVNKQEAGALEKVGVAVDLSKSFKAELDKFIANKDEVLRVLGTFNFINRDHRGENFPNRGVRELFTAMSKYTNGGEMTKLAKALVSKLTKHEPETYKRNLDYAFWLKAVLEGKQVSSHDLIPVLPEFEALVSFMRKEYPELWKYSVIVNDHSWDMGGEPWKLFTYIFKLQ